MRLLIIEGIRIQQIVLGNNRWYIIACIVFILFGRQLIFTAKTKTELHYHIIVPHAISADIEYPPGVPPASTELTFTYVQQPVKFHLCWKLTPYYLERIISTCSNHLRLQVVDESAKNLLRVLPFEESVRSECC